jgi:glycosyltransferase involved in cell wall biosynthesis
MNCLQSLRDYLQSQAIQEGSVEVLTDDTPGIPIGKKRNDLVHAATGEYVCFVDDDDRVSKNYIRNILSAVKSSPDVVGLNGVIFFSSNYPRKFIHSIQCSGWVDAPPVYYRTPNHLNPIRRELVLDCPFNSLSSHGEDREFSDDIRSLLKKEVYVDSPLYYYMSSLALCVNRYLK